MVSSSDYTALNHAAVSRVLRTTLVIQAHRRRISVLDRHGIDTAVEQRLLTSFEASLASFERYRAHLQARRDH